MGVDDSGEEAEVMNLVEDKDLAFGGFLSCGFEFGEVDVVFWHENHAVRQAGEGWTCQFYGDAAFMFYRGDELAFEEFFVHWAGVRF